MISLKEEADLKPESRRMLAMAVRHLSEALAILDSMDKGDTDIAGHTQYALDRAKIELRTLNRRSSPVTSQFALGRLRILARSAHANPCGK